MITIGCFFSSVINNERFQSELPHIIKFDLDNELSKKIKKRQKERTIEKMCVC
jgi:hypothetical protein